MRRARYRGKSRLDVQLQFTAAACNVKRWLRVLAWEAKKALQGAAGMIGQTVEA
jgi:hypothetical protein